jgi:hypothetical protein
MTATVASTDTTTVVGRFLAAVEHGRMTDLDGVYADDATLDATVPNWRFEVHGAADIIAEYGRWFAQPARFEELVRRPIADGEVVSYVLDWEEHGVPHAGHHCHVLTVEAGRIRRDQVWCGGRWPAGLLAEMEAARHAR